MSVRTVVVAHREALVAEGIAAALARYPQILPLRVTTTAADGERYGERADAVAIDQYLPGAESLAGALRKKGVRVVFIGDAGGEDEGVRVSTRSGVASLASALVPGVEGPPASHDGLTRRQREILTLVARGLPAKQVARHLGISPKTVEQHKTKIFAKLGVSNQTAAVSLLLADGRGKGDPWTRLPI